MGRGRAGARGARDASTSEESVHPRKIFVGGLAHRTSTQTLKDYFAKFGEVSDAVVLRWPEDGKSRGFGYVTFASASVATKMVSMAANGMQHHIHGHAVDVKPAVPGTNKVFVGGLPQRTTIDELHNLFSNFGEVSDAVVMRDPGNKARSRGFGFVCFAPGNAGKAAVEAAIAQYDHHYIRGKWIEVKTAQPPRKLVEEVKTTPQVRKQTKEANTTPPTTPPVRKQTKEVEPVPPTALKNPLVLRELLAPKASDASTRASDASEVSDSSSDADMPWTPLTEPMKIEIGRTLCFSCMA